MSYLPELVGASDDFVTRNRTLVSGLFLLVPLFCLYVLQSTSHSRKLRAQLIENQTKDDFVAIVSHELRTPLATISNVLSNALAGVWGELSDDARDEFRTGHTNAKRLASVVANLLDMSTIRAGRVSLEKSQVDMPGLIHSVTQTLQANAKQKGVDLQTSHDPYLGLVFWALVGSIRSERVERALVESLKDSAADVRAQAASALGHFSETETVRALEQCLEDPDSLVRGSAVRALGEIKDSTSIPALAQAFENADD